MDLFFKEFLLYQSQVHLMQIKSIHIRILLSYESLKRGMNKSEWRVLFTICLLLLIDRVEWENYSDHKTHKMNENTQRKYVRNIGVPLIEQNI